MVVTPSLMLRKIRQKQQLTFYERNGQLLLPMLDLITQTESAVDEVIDVAGRAAIEAVLLLSAQQIAGEKRPGKKDGPIQWYGSQNGVVCLSDRKLRVHKPRLRHKEKGEVSIPAYEALWMNSRLGQRILEILMKGVSTRNYQDVIPEMANTVGVSKSQISREFIEVSGRALQELCDRNFADQDILVVYLDGIQFGEIHVIAGSGFSGS